MFHSIILANGGSPNRVAAFSVFCFGDLLAYLCRMIRIVPYNKVILTCDLREVTIYTNREYVNVLYFSAPDVLLSGRFYADGGKVVIYDIRSVAEQYIASLGYSVASLTMEVTYGDAEEGDEDYGCVTYTALYCNRDIEVFDLPQLLASSFLSPAASRRVAPDSFVMLSLFAMEREDITYYISCNYEVDGELMHTTYLGGMENFLAPADDVFTITVFCNSVIEHLASTTEGNVELLSFTVRCGDRAQTFYVDKSLRGCARFYFRNCFNAPDCFFGKWLITAKTKVERSIAVIAGSSQFYDATSTQSFEVQSGGLTPDECAIAEQMFCSDDVRIPNEDSPDDSDFEALRHILVTESTCEIADNGEKPNSVKFTWRYAANRIPMRNPVHDKIFTEQYNYSFK